MKLAVMRPMPEPISTSVCVRRTADRAGRTPAGTARRLVIAGRDELREVELVAGAVVEHPAGLAHDVVGRVLLLGRGARRSSTERVACGGSCPHSVAAVIARSRAVQSSALRYLRSGSGADVGLARVEPERGVQRTRGPLEIGRSA